jgi:hypothetical protein
LTPILFGILLSKKRILPNSFCETSAILIHKRKDIPRRENNKLISLMNMDAKVLNKIPACQIWENGRYSTP